MRLNKLKPSQIVTIGATETNHARTTLSSKDSYGCANAQITRGFTAAPYTLQECFDKFPNVKEIAESMGVTPGGYWVGPKSLTGPSGSTGFKYYDLLTGITSQECEKIAGNSYGLGTAWMGCLWGSPMASFSCTCPDIGSQFLDYLKLRLNVATFWNTTISTPAERNEFLDVLQNGEKISITTVGDFTIKPGMVVELKVDNMSAYPEYPVESILTKKYYVLSVRHNITNSGVQETTLVLCNIRKNDIVTRIVPPVQPPVDPPVEPPDDNGQDNPETEL